MSSSSGSTVVRTPRSRFSNVSAPLVARRGPRRLGRPPQSAIGGSAIVVADGASAGVLSPPRDMRGRHTSWTLDRPSTRFYPFVQEEHARYASVQETSPRQGQAVGR
jgi:hypothetical protein